ncbi:inorganic diphosphatase (plasmid) [Rhizobium leguminosarum]|uniref:inorganic diphosphatase n=1 Tax=Rhizobium leguminosarum TaxID=384 RepID=UPI001030C8CC|nr:inorganic diphosphatase [Rhizobium leguminosarum]TBC87072.1 inorganic diphosphatase [Rhizobium leguminosarum]
MRIDSISIGKNPPDDVNVIVEVPVGGQPIEYKMNKESGALVVERFLSTPMAYPGNYGFVPHTMSEDGDSIDVLIVDTRPLVERCVINVRPIGVLVMEENGRKDEKIIAVPMANLTRLYDRVRDYTDLPEISLKQIEYFFSYYKDLKPGEWVKIAGWKDVNVAKKMILEAAGRYNSKT